MTSRNNRGSVLLMVVGMLTLIVMMGTTYLIVAHIDRQQSEVIAEKGSAESIAAGYLAALNRWTIGDLYFNLETYGWNPNWPFSNDQAPAATYPRQPVYAYIDAASADSERLSDAGDFPFDLFMASPEPLRDASNNLRWPHITNLGPANDTDGLFRNVDPSEAAPGSASAFYSRPPLVDTDGDGVPDARLFDTGTVNMRGDRYWIAMRITDPSGLLNTNVAGDKTLAMAVPSPGQLHLRGMLGDAPYSALHADRCGTASTDLSTYYTNCARRPMLPNGSYRPFAISDEFWLRWLKDDNKHPNTAAGRLHEKLSPTLNAQQRGMLTTYSGSRILPRQSAHATSTSGKLRRRMDMTNQAALDANLDRRALARQLSLAADGTTANTSVNFWVANLYSHISSADAKTEAFGFQGMNYQWYYGLVEQLVVTEAYAYRSIYRPLSGASVTGYCYAIELANLSEVPIDASGYLLRVSTAASGPKWLFSDNGIGVIDPGDRIVLYCLGGKLPDGTDVAETHFGLDAVADKHAVPLSFLDFSGNSRMRFQRMVAGVTTPLPVDSVTASDFGFANPATPAAGETIVSVSCGRRDDNTGRARYLVGGNVGMTDVELTDATRNTGHSLGKANNLAGSELQQLDPIFEGFTLKRLKATPKSYADLADLFVIGIQAGHSAADLPSQLGVDGRYNDPTRAKLDWRGTAVCTGQSFPDVPWAAVVGEMLEMLKPDETRPGQDGPDRVYGRININTAPKDVLRYLPWPSSVAGMQLRNNPSDPANDEIGALADLIIAYREKKSVSLKYLNALSGWDNTTGTFDYTNRAGAADMPWQIPGLRSRNTGNATTDTDYASYLTPGEVAIPLSDLVMRLLIFNAGGVDAARAKGTYRNELHSLYHAISNVIDVRTETFTATIRVELRDAADPRILRGGWNYMAAVDRSNAWSNQYRPVLLMFAEVK